jgi:hypothetical protein
MAQFGTGGADGMFGGLNLGPTGVFNQHNVLGDTWVWNGTDWTQITSFFLTPALPAPRFGASMAYDPVNKRTVLFGGVNASGQILSDTWLFAVQTLCSTKTTCSTLYSWSQVTFAAGASPPGRRDASFGYDPSAGIVLTGGLSSSGTNFADTWVFISSTNSWSHPAVINSPSPARSLAPAAQCASGTPFQNAMLFGGTSGSSIPLGDTWSIAPVEGGFFVWGQFTNSTHPGSRFGHGMAYYPVSGFDVLYGGNIGFIEGIGDLLASDTWNGSCNGTLSQIWSKVTPTHSPGPRWLQGMTTGPSGLKVLLFGGSDQPFGGSIPNGRDRNDTWQWGRQVACLPVDGSQIPVGSEVSCQFDEGFNPDAGTVFGGWSTIGFAPPSPQQPTAIFHTEHPGAAAITANWTDANGAQSQTFSYTIMAGKH